ncbi:MAG: hypothetical protein VW934_12880, partial [Alphaproteobacteria bacterium]
LSCLDRDCGFAGQRQCRTERAYKIGIVIALYKKGVSGEYAEPQGRLILSLAATAICARDRAGDALFAFSGWYTHPAVVGLVLDCHPFNQAHAAKCHEPSSDNIFGKIYRRSVYRVRVKVVGFLKIIMKMMLQRVSRANPECQKRSRHAGLVDMFKWLWGDSNT